MATKKAKKPVKAEDKIDLRADPVNSSKKARTVLLDEENFIWFQGYCGRKRSKPSHLIDQWIARLKSDCGEV